MGTRTSGSEERTGETTSRKAGTAPQSDSYYWAADVLADLGAEVHLAHPLGNNWGNRRVKNDERDATDLVDLLRLGRLAEAWIAPPEIRELREMTRYRYKLSRLRARLKAQIHAVMGKNGVLPARRDMFGPGGTAQLDALELPFAYSLRLESLRDLVATYDREIESLDRRIGRRGARSRRGPHDASVRLDGGAAARQDRSDRGCAERVGFDAGGRRTPTHCRGSGSPGETARRP